MAAIQFITYEELKAFLVLENDENKNLYTQDINFSSLKILALTNAGNLKLDFLNNAVSSEDLEHIKEATLILCKWSVENGNFKAAQSIAANLGQFNISASSQGDNAIPDEVVEHLGHTKYYIDISFLNSEATELKPSAITITTDDIERGISLMPTGSTLTLILNNMYISQEADKLLILQNEKKTQHLDIDGNVLGDFNKEYKRPISMEQAYTLLTDTTEDIADAKAEIEINDNLSNRNLAMLNKVSTVGENLKEGGSLFYRSYQYATLPIKSVIIGATPTIIPLPAGLDSWVDSYIFTPKNISTYLFKHLFYYLLNPFTDKDKQQYRIIARVTGADGIDYALPYDFDLNRLKSPTVQKKIWPNFLKLFANLNPANAPYHYDIKIQGLNGSEGSLLIETESAGAFDPAIPEASHFEIIEMLPSNDKLVRDDHVHFNDPNLYTSLGYVMPDTPGGGKDDSLPPLLQYAIENVPYINLLKIVFEIGENAGKITKTVADFGGSLTLAQTCPISNVGSKPGNDTSAATIGDVKALIHSENPLIDKNLLKNGSSKSVIIPFVINPNGTVNDLELPLETPDVEYIAGKTYADVNKIRILYNVKWNTGAAKSINANYNLVFNKEDNGDWLPTTPEIIISLPPIAGFTDPERTLIPQGLIKTSAGHPYKFDISFKDGTNASDYAGQKLFLEVEQIWYNELETGGGTVPPIALEGFVNQNFQTLASDTYPGDIDNVLRTITGWTTKLSNKILFKTQSNGALVLDETYRQEIADSGKDRTVRIDLSCSGFTARAGDYIAKITTSGAFDFAGNKFLINKGIDSTSNSYLGSLNQENHSLIFKIPHTIASGDLLFIEIESANCGIADMRPPYNLIFTEMGNAGVQGAKGDPGDPGGVVVRETMYNEKQTLNNNQTKTYNMTVSGINSDFKNIQFYIKCTITTSNFYYNIIEFIDNEELYYRKENITDPTYYSLMLINPTTSNIMIQNKQGTSGNFTLIITGERISTTLKKEKTNGKNKRTIKSNK